ARGVWRRGRFAPSPPDAHPRRAPPPRTPPPARSARRPLRRRAGRRPPTRRGRAHRRRRRVDRGSRPSRPRSREPARRPPSAPPPRGAGSANRTCWLRGLSTVGFVAWRFILQAEALEKRLRAADGAIERVGMALSIGDDAVEEVLAVAPHARVKRGQRFGI